MDKIKLFYLNMLTKLFDSYLNMFGLYKKLDFIEE